jgi:hypothetical protein
MSVDESIDKSKLESEADANRFATQAEVEELREKSLA